MAKRFPIKRNEVLDEIFVNAAINHCSQARAMELLAVCYDSKDNDDDDVIVVNHHNAGKHPAHQRGGNANDRYHGKYHHKAYDDHWEGMTPKERMYAEKTEYSKRDGLEYYAEQKALRKWLNEKLSVIKEEENLKNLVEAETAIKAELAQLDF